jgi:hypothetical protein
MNTSHSYTLEELLALREKLKLALAERGAVLGRVEIKTIGSVSKGAEKPNDIDLRIIIEKSLSDPAVQAAAKEAIRSVIQANCFDGPNARILWKTPCWQWPLDVGISDGTKSLWLKGMNHKTDEINFMPLLNTTPEEGFPEMNPSVPEPNNSSPATT